MTSVQNFSLRIKKLLIFPFALTATLSFAWDAKGLDAYLAGDIKKAREILTENVKIAKTTEDKFQAYYQMGWFAFEIHHFAEAIENYNQAIVYARTLKDPALEGKTLTELGLTYSQAGYYEAATKLFLRAIEIATPNKKVQFPHIWGQASQELGGIHLAMGNLDIAEKTLLQTIALAEKLGVLSGIAEGSAYLASLYLLRGNYGKAEEYAEAALSATNTCNCTEHVKSWVQITKVRVLMEKQSRDARIGKREIENGLEEALQNARKFHNERYVAEAYILKSRLLSKEDRKEKFALLKSAYEILYKIHSEQLPSAENELAKLYLEANDQKLAEFYLKHGLELGKKAFRRIDQAFILGDIATLEGLKGNAKTELQNLQKKTIMLEKAKAWGPLLDTQREIALKLEKARYTSLALEWTDKAIANLETIIENETDTKVREVRTDELLDLKDKQSELALKLSQN
jgi:tetratricopeptide (TPR) repeat protein